LLLQELHGNVGRAVGSALEYVPAFHEFTNEKLEAFLRDQLTAKILDDYQVQDLRQLQTTDERQKYYRKAYGFYKLNEAHRCRQAFTNFYLQNRIFMNDPLRDAFSQVNDILRKALTDYEIGDECGEHNMVHESRKALASEQLLSLFNNLDGAIQKRLRYAEAD
jgi:hypothetical protein